MDFAPPNSDTVEYRCPPVTRFPMGGSAELVYLVLKKEARMLDQGRARLLSLCTSFAPLGVHADRIAKSAVLGTADATTILEALRHLAANGFMLSPAELTNRAVSLPKAEAPPLISWLAIPTCNRPDLLRRCIRSFEQQFREFGRFPKLLVADDSNTLEARLATKAVVDEAARKWPANVVYLGIEEKGRLIESLARHGGFPRDVLEFAILGPGGPSQGAGANRNTILLHTLGDLVLSVDDDTICDRYVATEPVHKGLRLGAEIDPSEYWFFPDRQSALRSVQPAEVDVLHAHECILGKDVHALVDPMPENTRPDATYACGHLIRSLWEGRGSVLVTSNGAVGDSGMYSGRKFPVQREAGTRSRLLASEEHYRGALRSREILRQPLIPTISHGTSFISMFFGMDNRGLLPPFFPVGHCDDGVFAAVANRCLEGCYFGYLPWALMHAPSNVRNYFERAATTVRISDIVFGCVSSWFNSDPNADSCSRISSLGGHLEAVASLSEKEFQEYIRLRMWQQAAQRISFRESLIKEFGANPDFWAADLLRENQQTLAALLDDSYCDPVDLPSVAAPLREAQSILARYGRLLSYWPVIENVCRNHDFCK